MVSISTCSAFIGLSSAFIQGCSQQLHRPTARRRRPASAFAAAKTITSSAQARKAVASKLYPASIVPIALQNYLWARQDLTLCPRGAAVGSIAQTVSILLAVPLVAVTNKATNGKIPFISIDWLHGIEQLLMAIPNHIMAMSFRQAVLSYEDGKPLPESARRSLPMARIILMAYVAVFAIGYAHWIYAGENWTSLRFLGGILDLSTPGIDQQKLLGAPSFAVWIPHWTMFIDFATQLRYMARWGNCLGIPKWNRLATLHFPWALANLAVVLGHLHKDQCSLFKLLHPVFVFLGSITNLFGTTQLALHVPEGGAEEKKKLVGALSSQTSTTTMKQVTRDWEVKYTLSCASLAALFSYISLYLTPIFT